MTNTIKTLKRLLFNNNGSDKTFFIDVNTINYEEVFDALVEQTIFEDVRGYEHVLTKVGFADDDNQTLEVNFDYADKNIREDTIAHSINEIAEKLFFNNWDWNFPDNTEKCWKECVDAAVHIYFNLGEIEKGVKRFFEKEKQKIEDGKNDTRE